MKLYHANNGRWYGTQADAKAAVGKGNFGERDVPTDKWGLIGWLNAQAVADEFVTEKVAEFDDATINGNPHVEAQDFVGLEPRMSYTDRSIAIDDVIASAPFGEAVRIATDANTRVAEHLKEFADAKFGKPATGYQKSVRNIEDLLS